MPEADEGDSLRPLTPLSKRIVLWLPALKPPPLTVVVVVVADAVVDVVEELAHNGALAQEYDLLLVMMIRERVREAVGWDVRTSTKARDLVVWVTDVGSPVVLKSKSPPSPKEKARASEEVLIHLAVQLRLPGAMPPEVVHPLNRARDVLSILRSRRLSLATILQGALVPSGIGVRSDTTIDI